MRYLVIDGNNIACRASFAFASMHVATVDHKDDWNPDDVASMGYTFPTGAIHGFYKMLWFLIRKFQGYYVVVAWDGKSKWRIEESKAAVEKGIVPAEYKSNRDDPMLDFKKQLPLIQSLLRFTNIPQIYKSDEEADDIIASLVAQVSADKIVIATNDKDYYQLLSNNIEIFNAKGNLLTENWLRNEYNINPSQWIDVGALQGDSGDAIFGIPQWGEKTSIKAIQKYKTCEKVIEALMIENGHLRGRFPDLSKEHFKEISLLKNDNNRVKYPYIKEWMPFTGVVKAYENKLVKMPLTSLTALVYQDRVPLAKKLKQMKNNILIPKLPHYFDRNLEDEFVSFCEKYHLNEVAKTSHELCVLTNRKNQEIQGIEQPFRE